MSNHGKTLFGRLLWWRFKTVRCYGFALYWSADRNPILAYSCAGKGWVFAIGNRQWMRGV